MKKGKIYIGTSGWHYKHWKGTFYPGEIKETEHFSYYQNHFNTVEINNSFYHLPAAKTFRQWKEATPPKFIFAVKASRFITHMKKLNVDKKAVSLFLSRANKLDKKLGPVLFQLPPNWKINRERLKLFLKILPGKYRYTFEFRNPSWYNEEILDLLKAFNCAFCIYELEGHMSPYLVSADFVYVRLHGPGKKYEGSYSVTTLKAWAKRCLKWQQEGKDIYVYFDNDQAGYAAFNAEKLKSLLAV
jgi:uncharacterized protein YecE (DUF72 family)